MTREEVKAQLAKCPLEWTPESALRFGCEYLKAGVNGGELYAEYRIFYEYGRYQLERVSLHFMAMADRWEGGECVMCKYDNFPTLEEVKATAEAHRVDVVCRLLGIKD